MTTLKKEHELRGYRRNVPGELPLDPHLARRLRDAFVKQTRLVDYHFALSSRGRSRLEREDPVFWCPVSQFPAVMTRKSQDLFPNVKHTGGLMLRS